MKPIYLFLMVFVLGFFTAKAQMTKAEAEALKQQLLKLKQSVNWNDPAAAQKGLQKMTELTQKLMPNLQNSSPAPTENEATPSDATEEMKSKLWSQIVSGAAGGDESDILIAEPVRNEIAEAFGRVTIWGPYKQTSTLRFGYGWECMLDDCGWTMIPGFDNSPQYNVESVELCLL